jgi:hypothetical protein
VLICTKVGNRLYSSTVASTCTGKPTSIHNIFNEKNSSDKRQRGLERVKEPKRSVGRFLLSASSFLPFLPRVSELGSCFFCLSACDSIYVFSVCQLTVLSVCRRPALVEPTIRTVAEECSSNRRNSTTSWPASNQEDQTTVHIMYNSNNLHHDKPARKEQQDENTVTPALIVFATLQTQQRTQALNSTSYSVANNNQ